MNELNGKAPTFSERCNRLRGLLNKIPASVINFGIFISSLGGALIAVAASSQAGFSNFLLFTNITVLGTGVVLAVLKSLTEMNLVNSLPEQLDIDLTRYMQFATVAQLLSICAILVGPVVSWLADNYPGQSAGVTCSAIIIGVSLKLFFVKKKKAPISTGLGTHVINAPSNFAQVTNSDIKRVCLYQASRIACVASIADIPPEHSISLFDDFTMTMSIFQPESAVLDMDTMEWLLINNLIGSVLEKSAFGSKSSLCVNDQRKFGELLNQYCIVTIGKDFSRLDSKPVSRVSNMWKLEEIKSSLEKRCEELIRINKPEIQTIATLLIAGGNRPYSDFSPVLEQIDTLTLPMLSFSEEAAIGTLTSSQNHSTKMLESTPKSNQIVW